MKTISFCLLFLALSVAAESKLKMPPPAPIASMPDSLIQANELTKNLIIRLSDWSEKMMGQYDERVAIQKLNFVSDLIEIRKISDSENSKDSIQAIDEKLIAIFSSIHLDSTELFRTKGNISQLGKIRAYFKTNSEIPEALAASSERFFEQVDKLNEQGENKNQT